MSNVVECLLTNEEVHHVLYLLIRMAERENEKEKERVFKQTL